MGSGLVLRYMGTLYLLITLNTCLATGTAVRYLRVGLSAPQQTNSPYLMYLPYLIQSHSSANNPLLSAPNTNTLHDSRALCIPSLLVLQAPSIIVIATVSRESRLFSSLPRSVAHCIASHRFYFLPPVISPPLLSMKDARASESASSKETNFLVCSS